MTAHPSGTVEQRLRAAVESSPSGILMTDPSGRIVLVNREIERLFGYARDELLGQPVDQLVPERFRGPHAGFRASFAADSKGRAMGAGRDLYGRRKDGSEVPIEVGLTPVVTEEGLFVLGSVVDITARRRAEARFRVAVEASPNGMVMVDGEGRIILVNRAVERMFGHRRIELLGQSIELLVPERFRQQHRVDRTRYSAAPRERPMGDGQELFGLRKDGSEFPVEIGLNPVETDEGIFVLSSIVDISARRQAEAERGKLEEQLRQSQKLEAIGTLAGGIAHDFRNILNGIIGFGELLRGRLQNQQADADLTELLSFADRGKELVARILTFSRRQAPGRHPQPLGPAVAEAMKLLRATLPSTVSIKAELGQVPKVLADATSVHQVVTNLGTNAAHAMPQGGHLRVTLESIYVRDSLARGNPDLHEGEYAVLMFQDEGHGMDAATRARVFEPFFTTKPPGSGTGLGLAIVHGIMREHGGAVLLASEPGKGTSVRCFFPSPVREAPADQVAVSDAPRGAGQHLLYVDDEPALARVGQRRLSLIGYRVTAAISAQEALAEFRARPEEFDLVVTDFTMPGMNGLELAREIRRIRPDLPIILTTGYIDEIHPEAMAEAGVRRLAMKPVSLEELGRLVGELLRVRSKK